MRDVGQSQVAGASLPGETHLLQLEHRLCSAAQGCPAPLPQALGAWPEPCPTHCVHSLNLNPLLLFVHQGLTTSLQASPAFFQPWYHSSVPICHQPVPEAREPQVQGMSQDTGSMGQ